MIAAGLLALAALLLIGDASPASAQQAETILVSNLGETSAGTYSISTSSAYAQSFTAGSAAILGAVRVPISATSGITPRMSIYSDSSGAPGTSLHVLTNPDSVDDIATTEDFTSASFNLTVGTTYWVVVEKASGTGVTYHVNVASTTSTNQTGESDWTIGDAGNALTSGSWDVYELNSEKYNIKMAILPRNSAATGSLAVSGVLEPGLKAYSDSSNQPGTSLHALTSPAKIDASKENLKEFTSTGYALSASTTYWLVVEQVASTDDANVAYTASDSEASGISWTIGSNTYALVVGNWTAGSADVTLFGLTQQTAGLRPVFADNTATFSVNENAASGAVGAVTATDPDSGDTVTYSVSGTDAAAFNGDFSLGSASGAITVKSGATIDYESKPSYAVTITATDTSERTDDIEVEVNVTNADEAGTVALSAITPVLGRQITVFVTDPDGGVTSESWSWSRGSSRTGAFTNISGANSASYTPAQADVGRFLRARVTYTDAQGSGKSASETSSNSTVTNPPPTFALDTRTFSVNENATSGTVGTVTATDPDGDTLAYSVGGTDAAMFNGDFSLGAASGAITVKSGATIDYEAKPSYSVTITATDPSLGTDTIGVTVNVTNVDEAGTVTLSGATPAVGAPFTATLADPDGGVTSESRRWSSASSATGTFTNISGADSASYTPVSGDVGKFLMATVSYTDSFGAGKSASKTSSNSTVTNPPPVFADNSVSFSVNENATSGAVGAVRATDPDNDPLTYSVGGTDATAFNGDFSLGAASGAITVKSDATIDYETKPSYSVTITATDDSGGTDTIDVTINVTNRDDAGEVTLSAATPVLDEAITASVSDPDGGVTGVTGVTGVSWRWSRGNTAGGSFTNIGGAASASYTPVQADVGRFLKATAFYTDSFGAGKRAEKTAEFGVSGVPLVNVAPEFSADTYTRNIAEESPARSNVGAPVAAQDRNGDTLTYSLGGTDAGSFTIVSSSGQLRTKAALDYESRQRYAVTVTARDDSGLTDTAAVTIMVTNVDELGTVTLSTTLPGVGAGLSAEVQDVDGGVTVHAWRWARGDLTSGPFTNISGATSQDYTPVDADRGKYLRATASYTDSHGPGKRASGVSTGSVGRRNLISVEVSFEVASYTATEGGDVATIRLVMGRQGHRPEWVWLAAGRRVVVPIAVTRGNGATASDHWVVPAEVVFGPSNNNRTFRIVASDDANDDDGEWVELRLGTLPEGVYAGEHATTRVNLNDAPGDLPVLTASFENAAYTATEGGSVDLKVTLDKALEERSSLVITVEHERTDGSSTGGYRLRDRRGRIHFSSPLPLRFSRNQREMTFSVHCDNDDIDEDKTIRLRMSSARMPDRTSVGSTGSATVTCRDNDPIRPLKVRFDRGYYHAPEDGNAARVEIRIDPAPDRSVTIPIAATPRAGLTAADYTGLVGNVTFGIGETAKSMDILAVDDADDDDGERLDLGFGTLPPGVTAQAGNHQHDKRPGWIFPLRTTRVIFEDNDEPPGTPVPPGDAPEVGVLFKLATYTATEGGDVATVRVELTKKPERRLTIPISITGRSTGAAGYSLPENATFQPEQTEFSFRVTAIDNDIDDDDSVWIELGFGTLPSGVSLTYGNRTARVNIVDDDDPRLTVSFDSARYSVSEAGETSAAVRVTLSADPEREVRIPVKLTHRAGASGGDYSTSGPHYYEYEPAYERVTLRFRPGGALSQTFTVRATDEWNTPDDDDGEWLQLTFDALPERVTGEGSARVDIVDDDDPPAPTEVWVGFLRGTRELGPSRRYNAPEDGNPALVKVWLSEDPGRRLVIPLVLSRLGGATASDHSAVPSSVTFEPGETGKTFQVWATDDLDNDGGEWLEIAFGTLPEAVMADDLYPEAIINLNDNDGPALSGQSGQSDAVENTPATGAPTIRGTPAVDETLSALTTGINDDDGLLEVVYSYQWRADDVAITDATGSTYTLVSGDLGKAIKVQVTFTDDGGNRETLTSPATAAVAAAGLYVRFAALNGATLMLIFNATLDEFVSLPLTALSVSVNGAAQRPSAVLVSGSTVTLALSTAAAAGDTVTVAYTKPQGPEFIRDNQGRSADSFTGQAVANSTPAARGQGDGGSEEPVDPFTSSAHSAPASHDGSAAFTFELRFSEEFGVSYTTLRDHAFTVTGGQVTGVSRLAPPGNDRWEITVSPTSGADVTIVLPITEDCTADGAICADGDRKLSNRLEITVSGPEAQQSSQQQQNSPATGRPSISGTAQVGATLTASTSAISDADGLTNVSYAYQWVSNDGTSDSDIAAATASSYTLTANDAGDTIKVQVSFTDDEGNDETLVSAATTTVVHPPFTASIEGDPAAHDGSSAFTFEVRFSEEFLISYNTLRDHAFTVTGGQVAKVRRLNPPGNVGWEITVSPTSDADVTIMLLVTTDCAADGAVCTQDGRPLSNRLELEVPGPGG